MPTFTLVDVMQRSGAPLVDRKVVDEVIASAPLWQAMPAKVIKGTQYSYMVRTGIPTIGARPLNAGASMLKSKYETRNAEAFAYDGVVSIDAMVAKAHPEGKDALMADEMRETLRGALVGFEQGLIYGKAKDEYGMYGLVNLIADYMTISADPAANTEGSRKEGGASVWMLNLDEAYQHIVYGNDKTLGFTPEVTGEMVRPTGRKDKDGNDEMGLMRAHSRHCEAWMGYAMKSAFGAARLINESATHPLTDALLAKLLRCFPTGHKPTHLVMNQSTLARWEESRTKALTFVKGGKNANGATLADEPDGFRGLKLIVTDNLLEDETAENIAKLKDAKVIDAEDFFNKGATLKNLEKVK